MAELQLMVLFAAWLFGMLIVSIVAGLFYFICTGIIDILVGGVMLFGPLLFFMIVAIKTRK